MDDLLTLVVEEGASDLHITCGRAPDAAHPRPLNAIDTEPLRPEDTERLMRQHHPEDQREIAKTAGRLRLRLQGPGALPRERVQAKGAVGMVLRQIPEQAADPRADRPANRSRNCSTSRAAWSS
jgi:twitching motility protein PilT